MSEPTAAEKLAKLLARMAISEAAFKANPTRHLQKLYDDAATYRAAIEDALMSLTGADDLDIVRGAPRAPRQPGVIAQARNARATEILRAAVMDEDAIRRSEG